MTVHVVCENCGNQFEVADQMIGGFANCSECGKAARVPGLRDPLWRMWQLGIVLLGLLAGAFGYFTGGELAGAIAFVVVFGSLWGISRLF